MSGDDVTASLAVLQAAAGLVPPEQAKRQTVRLEWMYDPGATALVDGNRDEESLKKMNTPVEGQQQKDVENIKRLAHGEAGKEAQG